VNSTIQEQYERDYSWFSKEHKEEHKEEEQNKQIVNPISAPKELEGDYYGVAETLGIRTNLPKNFYIVTDPIEKETIINEALERIVKKLAEKLITGNFITVHDSFDPSTGERGIMATIKLVKAMETLSEQVKNL